MSTITSKCKLFFPNKSESWSQEVYVDCPDHCLVKGSFPNHHCHTCRLLLFSNHVNFSSMLFSPGLAGSSEQSEVELNCSVCCLYPWDSRFIPLGSVSYQHSSTSLDFLTIHLALFVLLCKSLDPYEKHSRLQKEKVRFFLTKRSEYSYQEAFEPGAQV